MEHPQYEALKITEQIVIACMSETKITPNAACGNEVGAFFKAIYEKVLDVTNTVKN